MSSDLHKIIETALQKRESYIQAPYTSAFRVINGFLENLPHMVVEVFGKTVVFHDYSMSTELSEKLMPVLRNLLPYLESGVVKKRRSKKPKEQAGRLVFGDKCDSEIVEHGVKYAIDLTMNQDASFYLDTRNLREWLKLNSKDKRVLNTFAYTGSMGISALVGDAKEVIQLDLNRRFLEIGMRSAKLNGFPINESHYHTADFWSRVNQYKTSDKLFDCVILDPPVYSKTTKGTIDVAKNYHKLINKVRPIISDGGYLITVNNALFQSGAEHHSDLEDLCRDGYLEIKELIPVPFDCVGYSEISHGSLPTDPSPYNHSTKITVIGVKKKKLKLKNFEL